MYLDIYSLAYIFISHTIYRRLLDAAMIFFTHQSILYGAGSGINSQEVDPLGNFFFFLEN